MEDRRQGSGSDRRQRPDFLAAQSVAKCFQDADFVGDAIDATPAIGFGLDDRFPPETAHHTVNRHGLLRWKAMRFGAREAFQQFQRLNHRTMVFVVGAEFQSLQNLGHHPPVMPLVRITDDGPQGCPIGRPRGFPFLDQVSQGLFADHWEHNVAHNPSGDRETRPRPGTAGFVCPTHA